MFSSEPEHPAQPHLPVDLQRLSGRVLSVDPDTSQVTLVDAGRRYAIFYSSDTIVRRGSQDMLPAEIKRGDRLLVSFRPDGVGQARLIAVAGGPAAPIAPPKEP